MREPDLVAACCEAMQEAAARADEVEVALDEREQQQRHFRAATPPHHDGTRSNTARHRGGIEARVLVDMVLRKHPRGGVRHTHAPALSVRAARGRLLVAVLI